MARVLVLAPDGSVTFDELALPDQVACEHYRRCLADRLLWAVRDAHDAERQADDARPAPAGELVAA